MRWSWAVLSLLGACVGAGLYTTPETAERGAFQIDAAFEAWRLHRNVHPDPIFGPREEQDDGVGLIPAFVARLGLAEGLELGLGLVRADVKVRLWHTAVLAVALDPIARALHTQDGLGAVVELPLLVGLRPVRGIDIAANGGAGVVTLDDADGTEEKRGRAFARVGVTVRLRLNQKVSVAPEISYLAGFTGRPMHWLTGGLAFHFEGLR